MDFIRWSKREYFVRIIRKLITVSEEGEIQATIDVAMLEFDVMR